MATDLIRYDLLVQDALRGVVRNVLSDTARNGLKGDHHFFITFRTTAAGLRLSNRMRERYPEEMTIILQHQFWDLAVTDHAFEVGLSFNKAPERLLVPFAAITSFVDPSVQFGLKFDAAEKDATEPAELVPAPKAAPGGKRALAAVETSKPPHKTSEVVTLKPHDIKPSTPPVRPAAPKPVLAKPAPKPEPTPKEDGAGRKGTDAGPAKIVSIDSFRKKP